MNGTFFFSLFSDLISTVSAETLREFRRVFEPDFDLFGYDKSDLEEEIFGRKDKNWRHSRVFKSISPSKFRTFAKVFQNV